MLSLLKWRGCWRRRTTPAIARKHRTNKPGAKDGHSHIICRRRGTTLVVVPRSAHSTLNGCRRGPVRSEGLKAHLHAPYSLSARLKSLGDNWGAERRINNLRLNASV